MKRFCAIIAAVLVCPTIAFAGSSAGNFSAGAGVTGNVFTVDTLPDLDPGIGGQAFFDYRWSPQFSTQVSVIVTTQDGTGRSNGDDGILLMGIPTFDLKFYFLSSDSRWDPYGLIGIGVFALSEGSRNDGSLAVGVGGNVGLGCDFYITERFSVGVSAIYRSLALINSTSGGNSGTALFPVSLSGLFAYHW